MPKQTKKEVNSKDAILGLLRGLQITPSAFALSIGVHVNTFMNIVNGASRPTGITADKIIAGLKERGVDVTPEELGLEVYKR